MAQQNERDIGKDDHPIEMLEKADVAAGEAMAAHRHHPVLKLIGKAGELGDQGPLYLIGSAIAAAGLLRRDPRCLIAGVAVVAAVGVADVLKTAVKNGVKRSRPHHAVENDEYRFEKGGSDQKEEQSFPSGHAACTTAAVETASRFYPRAAPLLRTAGLLLTASRLAEAKHWPLDLVAGALLGKISERLIRFLLPPVLRLASTCLPAAARFSLHRSGMI